MHYEIVVGRDEKSIEFGFAGLTGTPASSAPGLLVDHQDAKKRGHRGAGYNKGLYSKAISLIVEDTVSLWDKPSLPQLEAGDTDHPGLGEVDPKAIDPEHDPDKPLHQPSKPKAKSRKKIHLVLLTHGLHSNLGADMLYLKESIDAAAKQARMDAKLRKAKETVGKTDENRASGDPASLAGGQQDLNSDNNACNDDDEEEVIVRGFPGNAARTERGIQYLGKRLAKYVLAMTYPDQPYLPIKKSMSKTISKALTSPGSQGHERQPSHSHSTIHKEEIPTDNLAYKITSISFIGHSLGGLTQTYAIAYIHKHSPEFFEKIKPINFIALSTPFLGLSNENPLYIKFALDFGLVGRTGQDLGLTWRAPTVVRSGWEAMIAGIGTEGQRRHRQLDPGSKPLLRILPAGPAHQVLRLFRNRTVYSNVVNDGIVPLRTSCLLFLDWRGLGRVEKARRENGLVGTMAGWGWAEITGTNATEQQKWPTKNWFSNDAPSSADDSDTEGANTPTRQGHGNTVPQPNQDAAQDAESAMNQENPLPNQFLGKQPPRSQDEVKSRPNTEIDLESTSSPGSRSDTRPDSPTDRPGSPLSGFFNFFKPNSSNKTQAHDPKHSRIYKRGQTIKVAQNEGPMEGSSSAAETTERDRPGMARGDSVLTSDSLLAPPKTSVFEAAGDLLNPPIPTKDYLNNPASRPRTIFHDRVYHPSDIPPPLAKSRTGLRRRYSVDGRDGTSSRKSSMSLHSNSSAASDETNNMKVEEKIARAYHRDLSWRKVLVRLEPDAHNNIVVRRMFSNAYGWPVIKHLVDTHFSDSYTARTADQKEPNTERAKPVSEDVGEDGQEVKERPRARSFSLDENRDILGDLRESTSSANRPKIVRQDSADWDDRFFNTDEDDDDDELLSPPRSPRIQPSTKDGTSNKEIDDFLGKIPLKKGEGQHDMSSATVTTSMVSPIIAQSPSNTNSLGLQKSLEEQLKITESQKSKAQQQDTSS